MRPRRASSVLLLVWLSTASPVFASAEPESVAPEPASTRGSDLVRVTPDGVRQRLAELGATIGELEERERAVEAERARIGQQIEQTDLAERAAQSDLAGEAEPVETTDGSVEPDAADPSPIRNPRVEPTIALASLAQDQAAADLELARLRERLAEARAAASSLALLDARFGQLAAPARRALDELDATDEAVERLARSVEILAGASSELADRLDGVARWTANGDLGGFTIERETVGRRSLEQSSALRSRAADLARAVAELEGVAETERRRGASVRAEILEALSNDAQDSIDALYVEHVDRLRVLRLRGQASPSEESRAASLGQALQGLVARIGELRSVADVERMLGELEQAQRQLRELVAALPSASSRFDLALERRIVTTLEGFAGEETRRAANRLSRELLQDLRAELLDAGRRFESWATEIQGASPSALSRWREWLTTAGLAAALVLAALLLGTRRVAPMPALIRRVARLPIARGRVGSIVRWANLLQALFPSVACVGLLYLALRLIGLEVPAVWAASVVLVWAGGFVIGERALSGLTRPVSRSRPALMTVRSENAERLGRTYRRLGPVVALVIVDEFAAAWLGVGRLRALVELLFVVWLVGWGVWAAVLWRPTLAASWAARSPEGEAGVVAWMARSRLGFVLSPYVALRIAATRALRAARSLLAARGFFDYVRAKWLRRMAREVEPEPNAVELPERYAREFPLYPLLGDVDAVVLPRSGPAEDVLAQIEHWRTERTDGSLVLLGEKGLGKTTLVGQIGRRLGELRVLEASLDRKIIAEEDLAGWLGPMFGAEGAQSIDDVIAAAKLGEECVVLLDEAHNVFLRTIGGYRAFDALVRLVNASSENVFWLVVFNSFSWEFINESRGRMHYFRRLMTLPRWTAEELQDLIGRRNSKAGFDVSFDPMLLDDREDGRNDFRLIENSDGFFRMLWETSGGNPRIALHAWLRSLVPTSEEAIRVRLVAEPSLDRIDGLKDDMIYILAAICQHENLSASDLALILRMPERKAEFAIQFLRERGLVELKHGSSDRMTLAPLYYLQTLRLLRRQNLLFEGK